MLEIPPESVQSPAHDDIEALPLGGRDELIERGPSILRPTHTTIDVLTLNGPASCCDIPPQFKKLVLIQVVNVVGRNMPVDCRRSAVDPPARPLWSAWSEWRVTPA